MGVAGIGLQGGLVALLDQRLATKCAEDIAGELVSRAVVGAGADLVYRPLQTRVFLTGGAFARTLAERYISHVGNWAVYAEVALIFDTRH